MKEHAEVRNVAYEANDVNINGQGARQTPLYPAGTGPNVLFVAALCFHIETLLRSHPCRFGHYCALTHTHAFSVDTHKIHTVNTSQTFQLLSSVFVPFRSFHHCWGTLSAGVIPGSVTLIQVQIDFKEPPNIEFAFISLFRGVRPPEHHLTHRKIQPDSSRNPALVSWQVSVPLSSADVRQLLESTQLALGAFHRKETRVWPLSASKPRSSGEYLDT